MKSIVFCSCFRAMLFLIACTLWLAVAPARAQGNPPVTSCGLPAGGFIVASVTYTLTADCTLTSRLNIGANPLGITVTIHGAGFTVSGPADGSFIHGGSNSTLIVNQLTFDGGNIERSIGIQSEKTQLTNVSFKRFNGGSALSVTNAQITNTLFENNVLLAYSLGGNASSILMDSNTTMTMNHVVIRNSFGSGGAVLMRTGATLTTTGCLTLSGNIPYDIYGGSWTDKSTGPCSGTIGNGDSATLPPVTAAACGFPESGNLDVSATYTLSADCVLTGSLRISEHVAITINGNGHRLSGMGGFKTIFTAATSTLSIDNLRVSGVSIFNFGDFTADRYHVQQLTSIAVVNLGTATINRVIFENINAPDSSSSAVFAWNAYQNGVTTVEDAIIRNTVSARGALVNFSASITLAGCITLENNLPTDFFGTITDNRSGPCGGTLDPDILPPPGGTPFRTRNLHDCFQKLGAIGIICRIVNEPVPTIEIWGVTGESSGYFILEVRQPQIDRVQPPQALVACSADGRVAVHVWADRNITISMGPSPEGKTHHVTLAKHLNGEVLGTIDTRDGRPCEPLTAVETVTFAAAPALAPWARPQAARADGSLVHIVQPGDTLWAIANAYGPPNLDSILALNDLSGGHWLLPGQEILIRAASEDEE